MGIPIGVIIVTPISMRIYLDRGTRSRAQSPDAGTGQAPTGVRGRGAREVDDWK